MTPAARLQAAIDIVEGMHGPADRFLKEWFRARRFAGSADRRAIGERVFQLLRHRPSLAWRMGDDSPRALAIAALLAEGSDPQTLFTGGYGPAPLSEKEKAAIASPPGAPPVCARGEFPAWLEGELTRRFGSRLEEEAVALAARAPVDLRVNSLKAARDHVLQQLRADGFAAEPIGAHGVRCPPGATGLDRHALFKAGAFEVQDLASQMVVELAAARPGMRVFDLAAGAGGKSLALAAAMQNQGEIIASDIRGPALAELETRAARAGVSIIRTHLAGRSSHDPAGMAPFDLVFLDAPCSGSGTWRRQPELKARLTPESLVALTRTQDQLLAQGAALTGGTLVYATCSILPAENQDRVEAFLTENPGFSRARPDFLASPASSGSDGFYAGFLCRA